MIRTTVTCNQKDSWIPTEKCKPLIQSLFNGETHEKPGLCIEGNTIASNHLVSTHIQTDLLKVRYHSTLHSASAHYCD